MADLRFPAMADVSYESGRPQTDRGSEFKLRHPVSRALRFERRKEALQQAFEFEVVPRLLMSHYTPPMAIAHRDGAPQFSDAVGGLVSLVLGPRHEQARGYVQSQLDQKISLEDVYLHCIAPAALCLKQLWANDERDFAEVTLGLWRLQQLLRDFGAAFRQQALRPNGRRALLTLGPTSTQDLPYLMFGLVMLSEFYRRDGWEPWIEPESTCNELMVLLRSEWFDLVEISISSERRLDETASLIKSLRANSLNRSLCIAIGGLAASAHHGIVASLGGDVVAAGPSDSNARNHYPIDTPKGRSE